mmetsp:Transcript_36495/g.82054  ORF Transcript_36495/g.82054 Transcript_36495/m.82054 type:complete len:322 (-) Transcript_36495:110-1075(-)
MILSSRQPRSFQAPLPSRCVSRSAPNRMIAHGKMFSQDFRSFSVVIGSNPTLILGISIPDLSCIHFTKLSTGAGTCLLLMLVYRKGLLSLCRFSGSAFSITSSPPNIGGSLISASRVPLLRLLLRLCGRGPGVDPSCVSLLKKGARMIGISAREAPLNETMNCIGINRTKPRLGLARVIAQSVPMTVRRFGDAEWPNRASWSGTFHPRRPRPQRHAGSSTLKVFSFSSALFLKLSLRANPRKTRLDAGSKRSRCNHCRVRVLVGTSFFFVSLKDSWCRQSRLRFDRKRSGGLACSSSDCGQGRSSALVRLARKVESDGSAA